MPHAESHNLPEYYVAAIKNVQQEAKYIGAEGTYLDCEPYGMSEQKETLKKATTHTEVEIAISDAINVVGLVDYVSPTSSSNSERYVWYMGNLGDIRLDLKPYYVNTSTGKVVHNPPGDFIYTMGGWGSFVTNPSRNINPKAKTLTVEEAKAIDLEVVRLTHPNCWHHWVYIPYKEFADVVRRF